MNVLTARKVSGAEELTNRGDYYIVKNLESVPNLMGDRLAFTGERLVMICPNCRVSLASTIHKIKTFSLWKFLRTGGKEGRGLTITPEIGCPGCRGAIHVIEGNITFEASVPKPEPNKTE